MIYLSQLLSDEDLYLLSARYHTGLELIDFSVGMNLDLGESFLHSWEQRKLDLGNPPLTCHGPFLDLNPASYDSAVQNTACLRFSQAYEAARKLGAARIIYHTCRIPQTCYVAGWSQRLAGFYQEFLEHHTSLPVAVENVFDESPYPIADLASHIHASHFSLCLDVGHAHAFSTVPVKEWITVLSPWITHLHLHDNHGTKDEHLPIGEGTLPWEEIFPLLQALPRLAGITLENTSDEDFILSLQRLSQWQFFPSQVPDTADKNSSSHWNP